jgi:hypothetical protein
VVTPITWNANDIEAGVRDIRGKWINSPYYRGGAVEWNPLQSSFLQSGNRWQTGESPVIVDAPQLATQSIRFVNGVAFDVHSGSTIGAAQNELLVSHPGARPVEGIVLEGRESQVLYRNAITDGIDVAVGVWHGRGPRAEHIYVIRKMPSGTGDIEIVSEVTAVGSRVAGWDGSSLLDIDNTSIVDRQDDRRGWTLRPAVAWYYDAAGQMIKTTIVARMQYLSRGNVRVTKYVPRLLVEVALAAREGGELRCDLTGTFYPDANAETTTFDGYARYLGSGATTWATMHDASTANSTINDAGTANFWGIATDSTTSMWNLCYRSLFGYDLSSLSGATVSAADFIPIISLTATQTLTGQSCNLVEMTPASWTAITNTDYGAANASTTKLATDTTLASLPTTGNAATFSLNASGTSAVQAKVGSRIMLSGRIVSDIDNAEPAWSSNKTARVDTYTADMSGTTNDPKLVVTYTTGGSSLTPRGIGRGIGRGTFRGIT